MKRMLANQNLVVLKPQKRYSENLMNIGLQVISLLISYLTAFIKRTTESCFGLRDGMVNLLIYIFK